LQIDRDDKDIAYKNIKYYTKKTLKEGNTIASVLEPPLFEPWN